MILNLISYPVIAALLVFIARRILFTLAMFLPPKKERKPGIDRDKDEQLPEVVLLVPCRDEADMIIGICTSISKLDYPTEWLQVILISDGSIDGTDEIMKQEARKRQGWYVEAIPQNLGKAAALNKALANCRFGEYVYVLDADHRPEPAALKNAVSYFVDRRVAGVSGFNKAIDPTASPSAYYAAVESYVNQLVTMRAKDRLGLAPAMLGSNCCYRRAELDHLGGFRKGAFSEDSDLTVSFYISGRRVRFAEDVIAYQQTPHTIRGYLNQHIRWGLGLTDVARNRSLEVLRNRGLSLPLRVELLLFSAGYLDRLALFIAGILALVAYPDKPVFRPLILTLFLYLVSPLVQIIALYAKERMPLVMWLRLPLVPVFFIFDILAALQAAYATLKPGLPKWTRTERGKIQHDKA